MDTKKLILLKVIVSAHENHRLGLFKEDYDNLVKGKKFSLIRIEFDDRVNIDFTKAMPVYLEEGALAQKGRISTWIESKGYVDKANEALILFELTISADGKEHYYRYLSDANDLYDKIAEKKKELQ